MSNVCRCEKNDQEYSNINCKCNTCGARIYHTMSDNMLNMFICSNKYNFKGVRADFEVGFDCYSVLHWLMADFGKPRYFIYLGECGEPLGWWDNELERGCNDCDW